MTRTWRITALAVAFCLLTSVSAGANPTEDATLGVTIDPVLGQHVEPGGSTSFDGTPLLTIEGSARYGNAEIYAEGLPPVAALTSSGSLGSLSTTLGFLFSTARWYLDGRHVSLGVGETLYHQVTLRGIANAGKSTLSLALAATPVMRGGVLVQIDRRQGFDGENAAQTELILRDEYRLAEHVDLLLGARYINFAAAYVPEGGLADRNEGVAFTFGIRGRIGR